MNGESVDGFLLDQANYDRLVRNARPMCLKFVRRYPLLRGLADDLWGDVAASIPRAMAHFDPERGNDFAFVHGIVQKIGYRLLDQEIKSKRKARLDDDNSPIIIEAKVEVRQQSPEAWNRMVKEFRASIDDPIDIAVFDLLVVGAEEVIKLAEKLGLSVPAIYKRKSRILQELHQRFGDDLDRFME